MVRKTSFFVTVVFVCLWMFGCSDPPERQLRIGTNLWIGYEPFYVAEHFGLLKSSRFKMLELASASHVAKALEQDLIDVGALTLDEMVKLSAHGQDYVVFLVADYSSGGDAIISQPGIDSWGGLKGKKIGVEMGAVGEYVLQRALDINEMHIEDYQLVPLHVDQHVQAFRSGRVDALSTFEPARTSILKEGGNLLFDSRQIPEEIIDVIVVKRERFTRYERRFTELINAWFAAVSRVERLDEDVIALLARRNGVSEKDVQLMVEQVVFPDRDLNYSMLYSETPTLITQILRLQAHLDLRVYQSVEDAQKRALPPGSDVIGYE